MVLRERTESNYISIVFREGCAFVIVSPESCGYYGVAVSRI